ncbi:MAG: carbohydrate ABC transporter permease [Firmicutes bacterium]|jgi:multiple sugar transport system permease protein|nr:carbohydrate ABC transporter permease [Bacillota bacterium]
MASRYGSKHRRYLRGQILGRIFLFAMSIVFLLPILWMFTTSIKDSSQVMAYPPIWLPRPPKWENYRIAVNAIPFVLYLRNTVTICFFTIIGTLLSSTLVAYSLAKIPWPGRNVLLLLILSTMMLPFPVTMIPLFVTFGRLGWVNTFKPLIVPSFLGNAFYIFLLRQFFMTIPGELSDAARIDGASELGIFRRVILPLSKPVLAVVALFQFLGSWNDFLGPLIYLQSNDKYTLAIGLQMYRTTNYVEWELLMAASTLVVIPILVLFFFAQRTFIEGIAITGIKG